MKNKFSSASLLVNNFFYVKITIKLYKLEDAMFRELFSFNGRLNRKRYFILGFKLFLCYLVIYFPIWLFLSVIGVNLREIPETITILLVSPMIISGYSMLIRRLHDLNMSPWWCLLDLIPNIAAFFYNLNPLLIPVALIGTLGILKSAFSLSLMVIKGSIGSNDYGDDPLQPTPVAKYTV